MTLHDDWCAWSIMCVSASSWVAHSEVTSWSTYDTTLYASKKPPLMPISLPTSRVYWINWFDRKGYAPHIFWKVHNVLPVLLKFVLCTIFPETMFDGVFYVSNTTSTQHRHWKSSIWCFEWRYRLNHQKLKHPKVQHWAYQCCMSTPSH